MRILDRMKADTAVKLNDVPENRTLVHELASRAAMAFENARLYQILQTEVGERQQAEAMLQDANQRKEEFLAMLSHELRNPLAPIRNAVEVIRLIAPPDPKLGWATDVTERQIDHLTRLIDDLLDVARISQGKIVLQTEPVDLLKVVAQSVETVRPFIDSRHHVLTHTLQAGPVMLRGDFARLSQVVSNLLHNAAKYTDDGGAIHLSVSVDEAATTISVRDNGIGIEPALLDKVFDLFEQGQRSLDRSQGGLGVGLTLAQRLVHLHRSNRGRQRRCWNGIRISCSASMSDRSQSCDQRQATATAAKRSKANCRVLVVDDNLDAAQTVAVLLELAGHEVKAVGDGMQALSCAPVYAPEVIVLDIDLPVIDGYELAQKLRGTDQTRGSLIIALTATASTRTASARCGPALIAT